VPLNSSFNAGCSTFVRLSAVVGSRAASALTVERVLRFGLARLASNWYRTTAVAPGARVPRSHPRSPSCCSTFSAFSSPRNSVSFGGANSISFTFGTATVPGLVTSTCTVIRSPTATSGVAVRLTASFGLSMAVSTFAPYSKLT
jgi:hypothetical protein